MNHPADDTLLEFLLETVDEKEKALLKEHLDACSPCKERFLRIQRETDVLGSFNPDLPPLEARMPKGRPYLGRKYSHLAAGLILGFSLGYGYSRVAVPSEATVVASYLAKSSPLLAGEEFVVCETVDLSIR